MTPDASHVLLVSMVTLFPLHLACDLVFLGTIEVSCPVGDIMIGDAVQQLKALDLPTITVINFKASANGITVTDNASGLVFLYKTLFYISTMANSRASL